jgi:muconolactone delta-isomerase
VRGSGPFLCLRENLPFGGCARLWWVASCSKVESDVTRFSWSRSGRRSRSMRFLVTLDGSGVVGMPPEQFVQVLDQMVIPGVERLAQLEQEGRIHGGGYPAGRGGIFMIDADSSEEVDQLVSSLPHWGLLKVDVKPLISASALLERARAVRQRAQEQVR